MKNEKQYSNVQFIGHVLSTTPELKASVEEMSDWGIYLGEKDDSVDIQQRLDIVSKVITQALSNNSISRDGATLKVFTFPEFFWRGLKGAYYNSDGSKDLMYEKICDGITNIIQQLSPQYDLSDWLFLFGSILTTKDVTDSKTTIDQTLAKVGDDFLNVYSLLSNSMGTNDIKPLSSLMKIIDKKTVADSSTDEKLSNLLADILTESDQLAEKMVYNRCFVYYANNRYSIQKENKSKEDFILNNPSATPNSVDYYLQTMVNYPSITAKNNPIVTLPNSVFNCGNVNIGVEICLDHSRKRLLGYVSNKIISPVDVQIVISCGMQLKKDSAATVQGGVLFNCDGEYVLTGDAQNGDHCHSQLKTYSFSASCGPQLSNHIPAVDVVKVTATVPNRLYPHGLGEIHYYAPQRIAKKS